MNQKVTKGSLSALAIFFAAAALFRVATQDQPQLVTSGDMMGQINRIGSIRLLIAGLMYPAAIPQELLPRVLMQLRLAHIVGTGWVILIQAALFSAGTLPQRLIGYQEPLLLKVGMLLALDNGLISRYLWLPTCVLLLLLHLFTFPRIGR